MTVQDHLDMITYKMLSMKDVATVKQYLAVDYTNITVAKVKDVVVKGMSVGAYYNKALIGCYLLDVEAYPHKAPVATLEYVRAGYEEVLGELLSKLRHVNALQIQASVAVKKYLKVSSEYELMKMCTLDVLHIDDIVGMIDSKVIKKFKRNLQLEYYTGVDKESLMVLIEEYHKERNNETYLGDLNQIRASLSDDINMIDTSIVVVKDSISGELAGFVRYMLIDEYGAILPYVYGEYVYVTKKYRKGLTLSILYGYLCQLAKQIGTVVRWDVYDGTTNQDISTRVLNSSKVTEGYKLDTEQVKEIAAKYWDRYGVTDG